MTSTDLLSTKEAAAYTGFSRDTLYREAKVGHLVYVKMRSRTLWKRSERKSA